MSGEVAGKLHVANDVLADMVGHEAVTCCGIAGLTSASSSDTAAKILPSNRLRKGVVVSATEHGVHVDVYVVMEYGSNINAVSQSLIDQLSSMLTEYACVPLDGIDVHLQGLNNVNAH